MHRQENLKSGYRFYRAMVVVRPVTATTGGPEKPVLQRPTLLQVMLFF